MSKAERDDLSIRRASSGDPVCIVQRVRGVTPRRKSFRDAKYGGKEQARAEACSWRDAQWADIEAQTPLHPPRMRRQKLLSNSSTGIAGISPLYRKGVMVGYRLQTQLRGGPQYNKDFWIGKRGKDTTLHLAIAKRQR